METIDEEKILHTTDFNSHLRSIGFFIMPIIVVVSAILFFGGFSYIAIEEIMKNYYFSAIFPFIFAFIGLAITLIGFYLLYTNFRDAYEGKIKVRTVQVEKITSYKNSYTLHYTFQGKPASTNLPNGWQIKGILPQKAIVCISYYSNQLLQIELLDSKEFFSFRNK